MVTTRSAARRIHNSDASSSSSSATKIPVPVATPARMEENTPNAPFSCNVCLCTATNPVVTYCGHLFCWPCLYRWLYRHSSSHNCPVCRCSIDVHGHQAAVIPVYCSSYTNAINAPSSETPNTGVVDTIPPRPVVRLRWQDSALADEQLGSTRWSIIERAIDQASEDLAKLKRSLDDIKILLSNATGGEEEIVRLEPGVRRSRLARGSSDPAPTAVPRRSRRTRGWSP